MMIWFQMLFGPLFYGAGKALFLSRHALPRPPHCEGEGLLTMKHVVGAATSSTTRYPPTAQLIGDRRQSSSQLGIAAHILMNYWQINFSLNRNNSSNRNSVPKINNLISYFRYYHFMGKYSFPFPYIIQNFGRWQCCTPQTHTINQRQLKEMPHFWSFVNHRSYCSRDERNNSKSRLASS